MTTWSLPLFLSDSEAVSLSATIIYTIAILAIRPRPIKRRLVSNNKTVSTQKRRATKGEEIQTFLF